MMHASAAMLPSRNGLCPFLTYETEGHPGLSIFLSECEHSNKKLRKARGRPGTSKGPLLSMFDKQEVVKTQLWTSLENRLRNRAVLWLFGVLLFSQPGAITSCLLSTLKLYVHGLALCNQQTDR